MANPNGSHPLPGGIAYSQTVNWLLGRTVRNCEQFKINFWSCIIEDAGRQARIVWSIGGVKPLRLEDDWNFLAWQSLDGSVVPMSGLGVVEVGPIPVLFVPTGFTR